MYEAPSLAPPSQRPHTVNDRSEFLAAWHRRGDRQQTSSENDGLRRLEAALFVADKPVSPGRLAKAATLRNAAEVRELIDVLNAGYEANRSAFTVEKLASGYRLLTRPPLAYYLKQLTSQQDDTSLSPAALETLTIVAYRQPVTRAEVESIRGVASLELIKQLMDRQQVRIVGEDDSLGRPFLYGTTPHFLDTFGLRSLDELPQREALAA